MAHIEKLIDFDDDEGDEYIYAEAVVEDVIQTRPATFIDPPEFSSYPCSAKVWWGEPLSKKNRPSDDSVIQLLEMVPDHEWEVEKPMGFEEDY